MEGCLLKIKYAYRIPHDRCRDKIPVVEAGVVFDIVLVGIIGITV